MKFHAVYRSHDGLMRSVIDSKQWESVNEIDPRFPETATNLYAGMVVNGVRKSEHETLHLARSYSLV
jgi:hypothetical protein